MKAPCTLTQRKDGTWLVRHVSSSLGRVEISAFSREEALMKIRNELQYRIELCPCSGASGDTVELQVSEDSARTRQDWAKT
jgi:hypothetical protein